MSIKEFMDNNDLGRTGTRLHQAGSGHPALAALAYRGRMSCWILRILCGHAGMPVYCEPGAARMGVVAGVLGIAALSDASCSVSEVQNALAAAFDLAHASLGDGCLSPPVDDCSMRQTVHWLAHSAGLDAVETAIFEFAAATRAFRPLRLATSTWGELALADLPQAFSAVLNRPLHEVTPAFERNSRLLTCGLVTLYAHGDMSLERLLKVPRVLGQRISIHEGQPELILSHLVAALQAPALGLQDFHYMRGSTQLALAWLAGALELHNAAQDQKPPALQTFADPDASGDGHRAQRQRCGTHLLVTGLPGLGKTQWVRAVLAACGQLRTVTAMELVVMGDDGLALSGEERLNHLRLTLSMMRNTPGAVIVFDEADDVFRAGGDGSPLGGDPSAVTMANHRASLNRLMEDGRIPVIWIMNHPGILDPAVLRRFDTVIAFESMPRSVRLAMLQRRMGGDTDAAELARWADIATLTPALIDRLAVVVARARQGQHPMDLADCRHWLKNRMQGGRAAGLRETIPQNPMGRQLRPGQRRPGPARRRNRPLWQRPPAALR